MVRDSAPCGCWRDRKARRAPRFFVCASQSHAPVCRSWCGVVHSFATVCVVVGQQFSLSTCVIHSFATVCVAVGQQLAVETRGSSGYLQRVSLWFVLISVWFLFVSAVCNGASS